MNKILNKEVISFKEVQYLKTRGYNFSLENLKTDKEFLSEYKVYWRNTYLRNILIDFTNAE